MCRPFFHEESIHEVSRQYLEHEYTHTHTDKPKPICPPLFQSWGHKDSVSGVIPVAVYKINKMAESAPPHLGENEVGFFAGFL